jgi:hypothetical protein
MKLRDISRRARDAVLQTLLAEDPEVERLLVSGALVQRDGEHFWIESGGDEWADLEAQALRHDGLCDCGALLSSRGTRLVCRTCCREYPDQ